MVLIKIMGARKAREIWASIERQINLWERGIYTGLVGDVLAEVRARESCVERLDKEKEDCLACRFHITLMSGNMLQAVSCHQL